jgi:hypothetical protein
MQFLRFYPSVVPAFLRAESSKIKPPNDLVPPLDERRPALLALPFSAVSGHWLLSLIRGQAIRP